LKSIEIINWRIIDQRRKKKAEKKMKNIEAKKNILEFQVAKTKKKLKKQLDEMNKINGINLFI
jgi:hypothetical protein